MLHMGDFVKASHVMVILMSYEAIGVNKVKTVNLARHISLQREELICFDDMHLEWISKI